MKQKLSGEFVDASVDWITVTAKQKDNMERLRSWAISAIENQHLIGFIARPWFQSGYQGIACGHVQYGEREGSVIVRLGGYMAKDNWMILVDFCDNVSRIDLQCTYKTEEEPDVVIHRHYKEVQRHRRLFKKAPKLTRLCDDDGGYTVYTGRRVSNVLGRIYNKGKESKEKRYTRCVRYEVQFNGKRAKWVALATLRSHYNSVDIGRAVLEFFRSRGVRCNPLLDKLSALVSIDTSGPKAIVTDIQRKLEWLVRSVGPTVRLLVSRGYRTEVFGVLGLNLHFETGSSG